jgi:hypothetical protein
MTPRLGLQIDGASGNRSTTTLGTFNPLFPKGYYVNLSGYTGSIRSVGGHESTCLGMEIKYGW